jgi:hypothetical protein
MASGDLLVDERGQFPRERHAVNELGGHGRVSCQGREGSYPYRTYRKGNKYQLGRSSPLRRLRFLVWQRPRHAVGPAQQKYDLRVGWSHSNSSLPNKKKR